MYNRDISGVYSTMDMNYRNISFASGVTEVVSNTQWTELIAALVGKGVMGYVHVVDYLVLPS